MDSFTLILEEPTSGRAMLGEFPSCSVIIDNDIGKDVGLLNLSNNVKNRIKSLEINF